MIIFLGGDKSDEGIYVIYNDVTYVLNEEIFLKHKTGWYITYKEKKRVNNNIYDTHNISSIEVFIPFFS